MKCWWMMNVTIAKRCLSCLHVDEETFFLTAAQLLRHAGAVDAGRAHLCEHFVQPLQRPVQVQLNPAGGAGHGLTSEGHGGIWLFIAKTSEENNMVKNLQLRMTVQDIPQVFPERNLVFNPHAVLWESPFAWNMFTSHAMCPCILLHYSKFSCWLTAAGAIPIPPTTLLSFSFPALLLLLDTNKSDNKYPEAGEHVHFILNCKWE